MNIRHLEERDYPPIITVVDEWWGGRHMADMLPKLFFIHFRDTSLAVEEQGQIIAFLVGFISQTFPDQAYIHFVGIHPEFRKRGLGRQLYERFFGAVRERRCTVVRCVTSPVNAGSLRFHMRLGFTVEGVTGQYRGTPCTLDYDGKENHRILFVKQLKQV
jgi:ribosomal protein S18 acetylase RimI-like enzyme